MSVATSGMTVNEQKQQLSIAYVLAVAARAGYACQVINVDNDSIDVQLAARGMVHQQAVLRSPKIDIQLKATSQRVLQESFLSFPLPIKNFNDLREPVLVPRILVVLLLPEDDAQWLVQSEDAMISKNCAYWTALLGMQESRNQTSVTVQLPRDQRFTVDGLRSMMRRISRKEEL
jgi:hypothetical protein